MRANVTALAALASRKARALPWICIPAIAAIVAMLWIDDRLMILTSIPLTVIAIAIFEVVMLARNRAAGFIDVSVVRDIRIPHVRVETQAGIVVIAPENLTAAVGPHKIAIGRRIGRRRYVFWHVPGDADEVRELGAQLAAVGVAVRRDQSAQLVSAILGGSVVDIALRLVAGGLVVGSLANFGLRLMGKGGSWLMGLVLLGGATAVLVVSALIGHWLSKAGTAAKRRGPRQRRL